MVSDRLAWLDNHISFTMAEQHFSVDLAELKRILSTLIKTYSHKSFCDILDLDYVTLCAFAEYSSYGISKSLPCTLSVLLSEHLPTDVIAGICSEVHTYCQYVDTHISMNEKSQGIYSGYTISNLTLIMKFVRFIYEHN